MNKENISFNKEKFKQVLHYVVSKVGGIDNVGKTVLYKMMYFSDFDFYEINHKSITWEDYYKLHFGPAPSHFDVSLEELKKEDKIKEIKSLYGGFPQVKIFSLSEPSMALLNGEEIKIINKVINKLSGMSAKQVTAYSHDDIPWKATDKNRKINYDLVFYRDEIYSVKGEATC
ncbi:MAG: SocA family protein [Nanoarchaeota archaeon]|nr:SocA family protein [Nanoarchaeota archaeon]